MIRLVTLNMCIWPLGLRQCYASTNKDQRLNQLIQLLLDRNSELGSADVICLQEFFDAVYSRKFTQQLKKALQVSPWHISTGPNTSWCNLLSQGSLLNSGLIILSKQEPLQVHFESFQSNPAIMGWMNAGFLEIELERNHIINCHLYPNEGGADAHLIREKQLHQLRNYVDDLSNKAVVISGDFNIHKSSDEYKRMETILNITTSSLLSNNLNPSTMHAQPDWAYHSEFLASDYVLADKRVSEFEQTKILYNYAYLSDHYPVTTCIINKNYEKTS